MLLIGDIHATRKRIHDCIDRIQLLVDEYPEDDTIVFVGDYVYHFSHDVIALNTLFGYWIELVNQGKDLIVLAGNHDWINNQFVFEQAKVAFDLLQGDHHIGSLQYITQPTICTVQGKDCLFFPYTTAFEFKEESIREEYQSLCKSPQAKERISGQANSILHTMIDEWKKKHDDRQQKLIILHHRYIAGKAFPGQFARFSYASPALSNHRLDDDRLVLISGHLHQPFVDTNYCCIGSVWSTSPLEINQQKFLFVMSMETVSLIAHPIRINPYLQYDLQATEKQTIEQLLEDTQQTSSTYITGGGIEVSIGRKLGDDALENTTLTVIDDANAGIESIDSTLKQVVGTIRIKRSKETLETLISTMKDSSLVLDKSFADRKSLLSEFLKAKFGEKAKQYETDLEVLGVL